MMWLTATYAAVTRPHYGFCPFFRRPSVCPVWYRLFKSRKLAWTFFRQYMYIVIRCAMQLDERSEVS